ncbi:MAG: type II toxin-antitoxin system RelE/ParE family toxin [Beijerinckiaceae bacterium]|nr:type II toxin-antitoxin system RelE/ParE family toxin [Beijerinckiaceae bacterium]
MKAIEITSRATSQLAKLAPAERKAIIAKLSRYAETAAGDVTRLQGRPEFRLRQGDYRVLFQETETKITVVEVGHRSDIYK